MKGTEAQVKYADDLLSKFAAVLNDIPGDMCETKSRYIANSQSFLNALTDDAHLIIEALKSRVDYEAVMDIREEGAGVWDFWTSEGMARSYRNLFAIKA
jgi:hypothetical protein